LKLVRLKEKSEFVQLTGKEALEEALGSSFKGDEVIIILYDKEENAYEWRQGGSLSLDRIYWHLSKIKRSLLE